MRKDLKKGEIVASLKFCRIESYGFYDGFLSLLICAECVCFPVGWIYPESTEGVSEK